MWQLRNKNQIGQYESGSDVRGKISQKSVKDLLSLTRIVRDKDVEVRSEHLRMLHPGQGSPAAL